MGSYPFRPSKTGLCALCQFPISAGHSDTERFKVATRQWARSELHVTDSSRMRSEVRRKSDITAFPRSKFDRIKHMYISASLRLRILTSFQDIEVFSFNSHKDSSVNIDFQNSISLNGNQIGVNKVSTHTPASPLPHTHTLRPSLSKLIGEF